jgi:hypothetical protein
MRRSPCTARSRRCCERSPTHPTAHRATVELPSLGPLLHAQRDQALDLFATFLDVGLAQLPEAAADRGAITLCIAGGLWETVRRYALERRSTSCPTPCRA